MRRAGLIFAALIIAAGVIFATYSFFNSRTIELSIDDMLTKDRTIDANGHFEGKFKPKEDNAPIFGYRYEVEDKEIFITVLVSYGGKEPLPTDEEGYVTISFDTEPGIEKLNYRSGDRVSVMTFEQK